MCFLQHFSAVASQETKPWFFWVFAGATPPCAVNLFARNCLRQRGLSQRKQSLSQGKGPLERGFKSPGVPPPARGLPCLQRA